VLDADVRERPEPRGRVRPKNPGSPAPITANSAPILFQVVGRPGTFTAGRSVT
jgi:hypothetical protein